jgi:serine/threonine protein kinase
VTVVTKKDGIRAGETFALKTLNKESVCQAGQVQHVLDEKEALEMLHQPFILRLDATFQDENNLYFLTEVLSGGELWSILYEGASGQGTSGLPPNHCQFYGAITVSALRYIHHKGLAYRDLKPENIVVDDTGYLRLIDLGFAKKIPYTATVNGRSQVSQIAYTWECMVNCPDARPLYQKDATTFAHNVWNSRVLGTRVCVSQCVELTSCRPPTPLIPLSPQISARS